MNERNKPKKSMKLKALLITEDGEDWLCIRQYYLTDLRANSFLDVFMQGKKFKLIEENSNESNTNQTGKSRNQEIS